ncbi:primosomal protein N' (replication factor Y) - superfamily II helicase [Benzoatithermus flavus]|uniref:Primosomal protein N' (Replication factor Y)-superfamily II helicase n=1 Tax=Benzoatithermus flavus TaxID=3108223 RepID=A0ABU8XRA6_9PROT
MPPESSARSGPWGSRTQGSTLPRAQAAAAPTTQSFTCSQCGAVLTYTPGTTTLACSYCGHVNTIVEPPVAIVEHALEPELLHGADVAPAPVTATTKCASCGADFSLPPDRHAGACPSCGTPVVLDPGAYRPIAPHAVLPFLVGAQEARRLLGEWLKGLWFAPSGLAREVRGPSRLEGVYLPYWTFDSRTSTRYAGRRGDVYYETHYVEEIVDGRRVRRAVQVPKIHWTPVMGAVARDFDDVLVLAGESLPRALVEPLEPWDLDGLKPYTPDYLSGFSAELYRLPLAQGFEQAKLLMQAVIQDDIRRDIGGDQQIIERMEVDYDAPTFKQVLLPVWHAAFRFLNRDYHFVVNGRTGEVHGERPWSWWKIAGAALLGFVVLLLLALLFSQSPALQQALRELAR